MRPSLDGELLISPAGCCSIVMFKAEIRVTVIVEVLNGVDLILRKRDTTNATS